MATSDTILIRVISDTHNTLPRELLAALKGCDLLIHAGDFATEAVLARLEKIAPVAAVRGNCDTGVLATLPRTLLLERGRETILVVHDLNSIAQDTLPPAVTLVICGHTHVPVLAGHRGRRWLNPGSPVSPRAGSAPSFAELRIGPEGTEIIHRTIPVSSRGKNPQ